MDRPIPIHHVTIGLFVVLVLLLSGGGMQAQAQLQESARLPETEAVQPAPELAPARPLKGPVPEVDTLTVRPTPRPPLSRNSPRLDRGQKLLWGSVGLFVNAVCESKRDPYDTRCTHCDRVGDRAAAALVEGLFGL